MDNSKNSSSKLGIVLAKGETVVEELKKHPIGITYSMLTGFALIVAVLVGSVLFYSYLGSPAQSEVIGGAASGYSLLVIFIGLLTCLGIVVAVAINIYLFKMNSLIVTTEKVAQIIYKNIVDRKVIQLSIERVQDVTVSQIGILPRIFKYGTITIETAGDQDDCVFTFAPDPYEHARIIMDLHEQAVLKSRSVV